MDQETWIVVANSTRARVFRLKTIDEIEEVDNIVHCESRLREGELVSDRPGRVYDSVGGGRHAMEQELSPHKRAAQLFANEVCDYLKKALQDGRFQKLYIAAGPTFLGFLRQTLDSGVAGRLAEAISKDITSMTPKQIREHLPYAL